MNSASKHHIIADQLAQEIFSGKYAKTGRLPSEQQLTRRFHVSRPTVARALRDLCDRGLITRKTGSGSYIRRQKNPCFGLIYNSSDTISFFAVLADQIARSCRAHGYNLLSENTASATPDQTVALALEAGRRLIEDDGAAGIFLEPFDLFPGYEQGNTRLLEMIRKSPVPVVLLDRDILPFPDRSPYDLVGVDNFCATYRLTRHLIQRGAKRILFVAETRAAVSTAQPRIAGISDAMLDAGLNFRKTHTFYGDPFNDRFARTLLKTTPDAVICVNDNTAAALLQTFTRLGVSIPKDLKLAGFDNLDYTALLNPPLTTVNQPCDQIAETGVEMLIQRIQTPNLPTRTLLLDAPLVVRTSA